MLSEPTLEVGTLCSLAPSRVNSVRRQDACGRGGASALAGRHGRRRWPWPESVRAAGTRQAAVL